MKLVLSSLQKALKSLDHVATLIEHPSPQNTSLKTELRDSAIQRFKCCYELCAKFMKRQLEQISPAPKEIDQLSFRDLLRQAGEAGLIKDVEAFMRYRDARNLTSHAYDQAKAEEVYAIIVPFLKDAQHFLQELEKRNSRS